MAYKHRKRTRDSKSKTKRRESVERRTRDGVERLNLTAETRKDPRTKRFYVVGLRDGKIVYTSKLLYSANYAGVRKQRFLRRAAKKV